MAEHQVVILKAEGSVPSGHPNFIKTVGLLNAIQQLVLLHTLV